MKTLKSYCSLIFFSIILFTSSNVYSDSCISPDEDTNREKNIHNLFAWAEIKYPNFFAPSHAPVQKFCPWTYVYYPTTSTYIGVNDNNLVSVMGGTFGSQPSDIDTLDNLLSQMETESTTTDDSPNPVSTKDEVLPYFLDLSGGEVARAAATQASLILILNSPIATEGQPVIPKRLEKTDSLNSCLSGTRSFTHNLPNSYIRLYDAGAENLKGKYDFNLIANQCNFIAPQRVKTDISTILIPKF